MIQSPIVFLSILFCLFLWQRKAGFLMIDHASVFTEIVHRYLPKLYILIYQSCTLLFANYGTLLFTDYTSPTAELNEVIRSFLFCIMSYKSPIIYTCLIKSRVEYLCSSGKLHKPAMTG